MFCKKCGNQIDDDSAFCYKCGTAVSKVSVPTQNMQTSSPMQNVQASVPTQYVQTNVPTQNVQTSAPVQNMQTNAPTPKPKIKKISAKGTEVMSTEPIPSKYKIGKIITVVAAAIFAMTIPIPDENFWLLFIFCVFICVGLAWNGLSAVTMLIIRKIEKEQYASYIESENAEEIINLIAQPLKKNSMQVMRCNKGSNVVLVNYYGKNYELYFSKYGYFNISPDRPVYMYGFEGFKIVKMPFIYEHSLEDFPKIAYCVQETLKKA
ncbi:MAG: zinc ribbon domain-containing protein [Ruminococcus sp.]|nr:zinc ribbon domain-containing protein [Ruminococcus sp.]MCM1479914.1 zinc ribbon domain-containing protein [Muribaculaceae bacterium]